MERLIECLPVSLMGWLRDMPRRKMRIQALRNIFRRGSLSPANS
jgi:hypothetical protein